MRNRLGNPTTVPAPSTTPPRPNDFLCERNTTIEPLLQAGEGAVAARQHPGGRALEHGHPFDPLDDLGDELHGGGASPDHATRFPVRS